MKLAITGKGGVGKTTLVSLMAYIYADMDMHVLAIDADPSPCLGPALGVPPDVLQALTPIAEMEDLIYERTGAQPGTVGGYFKLNPRVDDIPDRFSVMHRGIRLLQLGAVETGGSGCICPESALLRALTTHILLRRDDVVLLDMYAGVEHLGRATADAVDAMIIVVEPSGRSLDTARQIQSLANDIGIRRLYLVGNKVHAEEDRAFIDRRSPVPVLGHLPYTPKAQAADRDGQAAYDAVPELVEAARAIVRELQQAIGDAAG
ncbi:MAG TPA: AAA family ATPase [Anaerolineae bacterium]